MTSLVSRDVIIFFSFCKSLCWFPHFSSKKVFGGFHQLWVILCRWVLDLSVIVPKIFRFDSGIIFQWHYCILSLSSVKIYLITFGLRVLPHPLLMGQSRLLCSFCFYIKTNKENSKIWENHLLVAESQLLLDLLTIVSLRWQTQTFSASKTEPYPIDQSYSLAQTLT